VKVEVALHAEMARPFLERLPGGIARIHASLEHHSGAILSSLGPLLEPDEGDLLLALMSDDTHDREFVQHQDFLLIKTA